MKKYTPSAAKLFLKLTIISIIVWPIPFILFVLNYIDINLAMGLTLLGFALVVFFPSVFFASKSRWFTIDSNHINLPRGTEHDGKLIKKRTVVKTCDIVSVEDHIYNGYEVAYTNMEVHTLTLKNGTKITFNLLEYGKDAEKEIIETLKNNINKSN